MENLDRLNKYANTAAVYDGKHGIIRLHKTNIVTFTEEEDGRVITLDSGGWRTTTTKKRMNETFRALGLACSVGQENKRWFVFCHNGKVPYHDGIVLTNAFGSPNVVTVVA